MFSKHSHCLVDRYINGLFTDIFFGLQFQSNNYKQTRGSSQFQLSKVKAGTTVPPGRFVYHEILAHRGLEWQGGAVSTFCRRQRLLRSISL